MKKMKGLWLVAILLLLAAVNPPVSRGQNVDPQVAFLTSVPLSGKQVLVFSLWDSPVDGTELWRSEEKLLKVTNKMVLTNLGETTSLTEQSDLCPSCPIDFSQQLWVQIERKMKDGSLQVIQRTMLVGSPYSVWSAQGNFGMTFKGPWNNTADYVATDVVAFNPTSAV